MKEFAHLMTTYDFLWAKPVILSNIILAISNTGIYKDWTWYVAYLIYFWPSNNNDLHETYNDDVYTCYSILYQLKNNMLYYVHFCNTVQTLLMLMRWECTLNICNK